MRILLFFFFLHFSFSVYGQSVYHFYVSPDGNDSNDGLTATNPFKTLEKARDEAQPITGNAEITVWLLDGDYYLNQPFYLTAAHSGSPTKTITYRAKNKHQAKLHLTKQIPVSDFQDITDPSLISRMRPEAVGKIKMLNLASNGFANINTWPNSFPASNQELIRIYAGEEELQLSRYPNDSMMTMKKVTQNDPGIFEYRGTRHHNWLEAVNDGLWFQGYWRVAWQFDAIRTSSIDTTAGLVYQGGSVNLGIGDKYTRPEGNGMEPYLAINLLEEIDLPGEWCVHFNSQILYIWLPEQISEIQLMDAKQPVISAVDVSNTTFRDLEISYSLGQGITIQNGNNNLIAGCDISKCIEDAVQIIDGTNHTVQSNDLHHLGAGGILLSGGNRQTLTPANHSAINNYIYEFGQITRIYAPAVFIPGRYQDNNVGMYVAHNKIYGTPHVGIEYCGNNNIFEYNEIYDICRVSNDMGAFYSYADWTSYGNIVRYNYLHDAIKAHGVYFDDGDSGDEVYQNIMSNIDVGVFLGGGHDNIVTGNLAVNCLKTVHIDNRGVSRGYNLSNTTLVNRVLSVDYQNPPWSDQFPQMYPILDTTYSQELPVGCAIDCNVGINTGQVVDINSATAMSWEVILGTNYSDTNTGLSDVNATDLNTILAATGYNGQSCLDGTVDWNTVGLIADEYRSERINLTISMAIEGPFNATTGLMATYLNDQSILPIGEPYAGLGMHTGREVTSKFVLSKQSVVDWVLVELRDKNDASQVIASAAGLLLDNGKVVDIDGRSPMPLPATIDSYYIAVQHRNHLGVMTANPINLDVQTAVDFRAVSLSGGMAATNLIGGIQALWAGDANKDGLADSGDRSDIWNARNGSGYLSADCNLDGWVDSGDRSMGWNNRNKMTFIP